MTNDRKKPLKIKDRCDVSWRDGTATLKAVVVERRPLNVRRLRGDNNRTGSNTANGAAANSSSSGNKRKNYSVAVDDLSAEDVEYYVHYVDHDRRLDEWVTFDRFHLDTLEESALAESSHVHLYEQRSFRRRSSASLNGMAGDNASSAASLDASDTASGDATQTTTTNLLSGGNWHGTSDPAFEQLEREHEETTKVKNIEKIIMGDWEIEAWYYSPYPEEYSNLETLFVCEYCLSYMRKAKTYKAHRVTCKQRCPPGKMIYKEGDLCVYEIDGQQEKVYCQKLCLLAKLFLDHKTLYFDVSPFFFYIITKVDQDGAHIVGYFSKEKMSTEGYNLACILTLPQYQQSGYGKFIISLSYELSKLEGKTGSPEKPLSDLGKLSYRSYWTHILMNLLHEHDCSKDKNISINDMSIQTGIKTEDIISTLQSLDMVKVWRGQHVVYVKQSVVSDYMKQNKQLRLCKSKFLDWEPPAGSSSKDS